MTKELETARSLEAMQPQKSEIYYTAIKELTKKQKEQAERERIIKELSEYIERAGNDKPIIYAITFDSRMNINGNRRHTAKYYLINNGHQWHISRHIALLNHGTFKAFKAYIGGYADDAIKHVSEILFNDERTIELRDLNP
jgi:hypothetical protein